MKHQRDTQRSASRKGDTAESPLARSKLTANPKFARRFLLLALIMVGACAAVMVVITVTLYRHEIREQRKMLQVTAQSQARLIESVARSEASVAGILREADPDHDAATATLSQIISAHEQFEGFGETGEFTLARREGGSIVFILRHRHGAVEHPLPVAFDSDLAEPMRRALNGLSGTVIGPDYRGATVMAAHEPVAVLNLGVVAKIDMAEIRKPFIKSGLSAAAVSLVFVLVGTTVFFWVGKPIIARLETYSQDLEKEITDRKQAEEELHRYEHIVSSTTDMLALRDRDHVYLAANAAYAQAFTKTPDEMIGRTPAEVFGDDVFYTVIRPMAERCLAGESVRYRDWFDFPATGRRYMDVAYAPHLGPGTEVRGYVVTARDITERRRAEEALLRSNTLLSQAERMARIGSWQWDIVSNEFIFSEQWRRNQGVTKSRLSMDDLIPIAYPDDREAINEAFQDVLNGVKPKYDIEHRIIRQDNGEVRFVRAIGEVAERSESGEPLKMFGFAQDITEEKRAEEERLSLERQMQHAQKLESLGVLAGGIAHDFNNLLMTILGNADLAMYELSPSSPARECIEEIEKASKRAAELAKQMLAYSGKGQFVIESIDLRKLIEEMAQLIKVSTSKKAELKFHFADDMPLFDGDATQIRQIIMNLITNASEAIGDNVGVISLSTGSMECDRAYLDAGYEILLAGLDEALPEGLYVYLEVADTGCGMDNEAIEKVFDPFFTTKFAGRGLGLAAVLGIVRGHHGTINIYSEPDKGTTFKILFPASELPVSDDAIQKQNGSKAATWRGRGTILLADDEKSVFDVGKKMLNKMGFSVMAATDGHEAVEVFRKHADQIDCVLLDLTMPHMDGEQAFRELRRIRPDVKVILSSGYNEQDATQHFGDKGLAGFIQKPYVLATLRAKLMEVLPGDKAGEVA